MGIIKDLAEQNLINHDDRINPTLDGTDASSQLETFENNNAANRNNIKAAVLEAYREEKFAKEEKVKGELEDSYQFEKEIKEKEQASANQEAQEENEQNDNNQEQNDKFQNNKANDELQEQLDNSSTQKRIREKKTEEESTKEENDSEDRFNKKDTNLKEANKAQSETDKLDKLGNKDDKLNGDNSLSKIRGTEKSGSAAKKGTKKAAEEAGSSMLSKGVKVFAVVSVIKSAFSGVTNDKKSEDDSSSTTLLLIIGIVFLLSSPIFLLMMIMVGTGGRSSYESQTNNNAPSATAGEIILWNTLMEHFDDNETAVLGIMCNVQAESGFKANNLEDVNNTRWNIGDEEYTALVNDGTITKEHFCMAQYNGSTTSTMNQYGQWVTRDGGYGFCQFTAYTKKEMLYDFATEWFDTGVGEGQAFNIADNNMQANYVAWLLDNVYTDIDNDLRNAASVEDAVFIWCDRYEVPAGDRHAIASQRAQNASIIKASCEGRTGLTVGSTDFTALEGTYIFQTDSGPCVTCSVANMLKRYCYMMGDEQWDEITPALWTDDGESLHDDIVAGGDSNCGWGCFDYYGSVHSETNIGWSPGYNDTVNIHGIECTWTYVTGTPSKDELIQLLNEHPEGIAATGVYGYNKAHGKTITRYDADTDTFYCIDPGAWGSSHYGYCSPDAGARYEMPLANSRCWQSIGAISYYRYLTY